MTPVYQLQDIQMRFADTEALNIESLVLPANQSTALLGENGAGKSTLMHLLAFISRPQHGHISLGNQLISDKPSAAQRRRIGFVSQQPYLLPGTVRDNLRLALKLQQIPKATYGDLIEQALALVNLTNQADQDAATLSGGELKRAAIARAIAYQPDILLLDEPFSHLDQRHIRQLEQTITQFAAEQDKTVIFSTHDRLQAMAIADHSISLVGGRVTAAPLLNLYHGQCRELLFHTGRIIIHVADDASQARHIAIDPSQIIISDQPLHHSSMLNRFQGRLVQIAEESGHVRLLVDCGELFHAIITPTSLQRLSLHLGDTVWLHFKASAVSVF
ncbi:ATP-binding cassette domain-containing protein [uncultured Methylophaga sp.]|uniref:ATP-binding cassette domain-containing protein n=1 Tax=uncultured Methylophaga sp. TaxID=285271 RepID=UPI00261B0B7E|nr:ATP-binding cassette domain-containing protein [uncultured Methylophaga sp.]